MITTSVLSSTHSRFQVALDERRALRGLLNLRAFVLSIILIVNLFFILLPGYSTPRVPSPGGEAFAQLFCHPIHLYLSLLVTSGVPLNTL
jgi:hypothetical protein